MKIDFRRIIFYLPANVQGLSYHLDGYIKEMDFVHNLIFVVVFVRKKNNGSIPTLFFAIPD